MMLPRIEFFSPENVFVTGLGVQRALEDWQYYLPFKRYAAEHHVDHTSRDPHVKFALPLSESRVFVATHDGELALIDLVDDRIVARGKIGCIPLRIQVSATHRHLIIQDEYSLFVLDATTLALVYYWWWIERSGDGWVSNAAAETSEDERKKADGGTLVRLHLSEPVRELGGGKLGGRFTQKKRYSWQPESRSGSYVFDLTTGAIERNEDVQFRESVGTPAFSGGMQSAQQCWRGAATLPAAFKALVEKELMVNLVLADSSRDAALVALDDLARRMESDLDSLICCDSLCLRFVMDGHTVDTVALFDRLVREGWVEAVPILRRLMLTYLNTVTGGEGEMPWQSSGQAICALRALMLLDPDSHNVYRLYLEKGDLEHDHNPYDFYAEYLDRHGIRNEADVRFGIFLTVMGCLDTQTDPSALLLGAERHVTPHRFADIVIEEAGHLDDFWQTYAAEYVEFIGKSRRTAFLTAVIDDLRSRS